VGTTAPTPGIRPRKKPIAVPRSTGSADRRASSGPRNRSRSRVPIGLKGTSRSRLSRISPTPKSPIATITTLMPDISSSRPNVKRGAPATGSMPTMAIRSPITAETRASTIDRPARLLTSDRPTSISAKNSGGPNFNASLVSGTASSTRPSVATMPPTNEPSAATVSAGPARPWRAIAYPSMQVIAEAASPGTLTRTDVSVPPYMAP
jgi:hypothetical protein